MLATSSRAILTGLAAAALSLVLTVSLGIAEPGGIASAPSRDVTPPGLTSVIPGPAQQGPVARRRRHRPRPRTPRLLDEISTSIT